MAGISVEFLGTGTSSGVPMVACGCRVCTGTDPKDKRLRSSVLITTGGKNLLIDAGPDLRQQLLRSRVQALDGVLITHEHMDHVAGIDELRALNFKQGRAMDIYAPPAANAAIRRMFHYAFAEARYPGVPELRLHDIADDPIRVAGIPVLPVEVLHHRMPVLGYRIGRVAYVTDAKVIPIGSKHQLSDLDILIINALRISEHIAHLSLSEALELVRELRPKRTYLTHISHLMGPHAEVAASLPAGVQLAYDGLVVA